MHHCGPVLKKGHDDVISHGFTHCKLAVAFGSRQKNLRSILAERAKLELSRDVIQRLRATTAFIQNIGTVWQWLSSYSVE